MIFFHLAFSSEYEWALLACVNRWRRLTFDDDEEQGHMFNGGRGRKRRIWISWSERVRIGVQWMKHMEGGGDRRMIRMKDHSFRRVCLNQICRVERICWYKLIGWWRWAKRTDPECIPGLNMGGGVELSGRAYGLTFVQVSFFLYKIPDFMDTLLVCKFIGGYCRAYHIQDLLSSLRLSCGTSRAL